MKVVLTSMFCIGFGMAFASSSVVAGVYFDKIKDKDKGKLEKYSLKNIHRPASFFSLSSLGQPARAFDNSRDLIITGFQINNTLPTENNGGDGNDAYVNSAIRLKTGNSVVIYPFSYKVKAANPFSLFKTPAAPTR